MAQTVLEPLLADQPYAGVGAPPCPTHGELARGLAELVPLEYLELLWDSPLHPRREIRAQLIWKKQLPLECLIPSEHYDTIITCSHCLDELFIPTLARRVEEKKGFCPGNYHLMQVAMRGRNASSGLVASITRHIAECPFCRFKVQHARQMLVEAALVAEE